MPGRCAGTRNGSARIFRRRRSFHRSFADDRQAGYPRAGLARGNGEGAGRRPAGPEVFLVHPRHARRHGLPAQPHRLHRRMGLRAVLSRERIERFWNIVPRRSAIKPAGLGARDTLRLEVGYPLYGHELSDRAHADRRQPRAIHGSKQGIHRQSRPSSAIWKTACRGSSSGFSSTPSAPRARRTRSCPAAKWSAKSPAARSRPASASPWPWRTWTTTLHTGPGMEIDVHGKLLSATVVELPFYKNGTARKKTS